MIFEQQKNGYILITCLLLLLVLTIVGMAALGTSTLDNVSSGNIYVNETQCAESEPGPPFAPHIVSNIIFDDAPSTQFSNILNDNNLRTELRSYLFSVNDMSYSTTDALDPAPDLTYTSGGSTVNVDIDKNGSDNMFGAGKISHNCYKGVGKCEGKGRVYYYRINSRSFNAAGNECITGAYYKYIDK